MNQPITAGARRRFTFISTTPVKTSAQRGVGGGRANGESTPGGPRSRAATATLIFRVSYRKGRSGGIQRGREKTGRRDKFESGKFVRAPCCQAGRGTRTRRPPAPDPNSGDAYLVKRPPVRPSSCAAPPGGTDAFYDRTGPGTAASRAPFCPPGFAIRRTLPPANPPSRFLIRGTTENQTSATRRDLPVRKKKNVIHRCIVSFSRSVQGHRKLLFLINPATNCDNGT